MLSTGTPYICLLNPGIRKQLKNMKNGNGKEKVPQSTG